jgi:flagellar protein FlaI
VLAYLIDRGLNTYTQVAATLQAFINDEETILALMARDELERSLEDLREMESVKIDVDPEKEEMVPRPTPAAAVRETCAEILARAEDELWPDYRDLDDVDVADALVGVESAPDVAATGGEHHELDALDDRAPPALDDGSGPSAGPAGPDDDSGGESAAGTTAGTGAGVGDDAADDDGSDADDAVAWDVVDDGTEPDETGAGGVDLFDRFDEESDDGADGSAPDDGDDARSEADDAASGSDPEESLGIKELLEGTDDDSDDGSADGGNGTMWDASGFEQVDPNEEGDRGGSDADGDQAASDGGVVAGSGGDSEPDADSAAGGDDDAEGEREGGGRSA